jgi:molybdate transport system substrate-binding protein
MKNFLTLVILIACCFSSAQAQTPAQPADPSQARPALPVLPDSISPPAPATPATSSTSSTNSAPTASATQIAVAIIADSSLKQVIAELAQGWADSLDNSPQVPITLTNASTLTAKVEAAPTWDVVISADVADMKDMTSKGVVTPDGQRSLARNSVVIYGRKALVKDDDLDWFDLIGTEWKKTALGNPDLVASGRVAKRALQKHSLLDDDHKDNFVYEPMEKLAVAAVDREEADAVFLFKTDALRMSLPGFAIFPITTDDAPPIFYTASVSRLSKNPTQAHAFIDYCGSDAAKPIWQKYGFETN